MRFIRTLDALAIPCAIVTGAFWARLRHHLSMHALTDRFQAIVADEDWAVGKPAPAPFLAAAVLFGIELARCLAIEDPHNGAR